MTETKKKRIKLDVYADGIKRSYFGRLLGLIDDEEFNHLLFNKPTQTTCKTRATVSTKTVVDNYQTMDGLRLMMFASEIDGKTAAPHLFISERLHMVSYVIPSNQCGFTGESDSYLMVEEVLE